MGATANLSPILALCLRLLGHMKGGQIMKLHRYFIGLSLAGLLLGNPAQGLADDESSGRMDPMSSAVEERTAEILMEEVMENAPIDESAQRDNQAEPFDIVRVEYCHVESALDPITGEIFDVYALCTDDLEIS
jgi:hypothetical protein